MLSMGKLVGRSRLTVRLVNQLSLLRVSIVNQPGIILGNGTFSISAIILVTGAILSPISLAAESFVYPRRPVGNSRFYFYVFCRYRVQIADFRANTHKLYYIKPPSGTLGN